MKMKEFKGKAIYQPKGKAAEYSKWACNFYVGCSNGCTYCYLKKGRGAAVLGGETPKLKACFKDENHALEVFEKELKANLPELQKHGLFFSFTTEPMLQETVELTISSLIIAMKYGVFCKVLTKISDENIDRIINNNFIRNNMWSKHENFKKYIAFGFTLTGHDELEPNASTNAERIEAMRKLHEAGFKTWASIEPIIDFYSSRKMIDCCYGICDLFKVGLESGKKYDKSDLRLFMQAVINACDEYGSKIYLKDSLLKQSGINREDLPSNCVTRDYNIFNT